MWDRPPRRLLACTAERSSEFDGLQPVLPLIRGHNVSAENRISYAVGQDAVGQVARADNRPVGSDSIRKSYHPLRPCSEANSSATIQNSVGTYLPNGTARK